MSIELRNVRKSFRLPGGETLSVLNVPEFKVARGEQVALVGSSGGGKTTLLNVISGITAPDSGEVLIDGRDIAKLHEVGRDRFRAAKIGFVFQTFNLLPAFTALENVLLGSSFASQSISRAGAIELLQRVGLGHRLSHRPQQMSVGEQQRVAVARAMANRPVVLLADEPTANVDSTNQAGILQLIRETSRENNVTVLIVTHDRDIAAQFDRVDNLADFNRPEVAV